ncbi:hypothetical protein K3Z72_001223 [Escherichia coli]|nr:hypothetical protein [Escherichia coli]EIA8073734.1 hypothetical protein [Escherichia coli]EIX4165013.1 hypothetical protein [Escherichia coli]ELM8923472.1 hypothetical protein [Escherichia coli]ELM8954885.1 hypothetical protein [Escherichia coli]
MKIVKAEVFVTCPGRNFVTLKITTEDGITGLGDATLNGRELSVASYLQDHLCPQLIGRDAHRIEDFNSIWDCKQLIEEQLIDYIRTTLTHAGGITGMRRIADFASLYQVRTGSHGPSDLSPVCMAAALHFDLWVPNFGVQEYMGYSEQMLEVFPHNWTFDNGYMHPGDKPGLGIEFDEKLAAKYPYEPAYLPVARLEDGTLWNW